MGWELSWSVSGSLHLQEERLELFRRKWLRHNESACATLSAQLELITNRLQASDQSDASPIVQTVTKAAAEPTAPSLRSQSLCLCSPERFSGDSCDCHPFLSQCELQFDLNSSAFSPDRAKVTYVISYLSGRVRLWATVEWSCRSAICDSRCSLIHLNKCFSILHQVEKQQRFLFLWNKARDQSLNVLLSSER